MSAATATAVTGNTEHEAAQTSGGIPFGKPTEAEMVRFHKVIATLYEKMGSRCLNWVSDVIQGAADGQGGEVLTTLKFEQGVRRSAKGLPDGLLPEGKRFLDEMPIYVGQEYVSCLLESVRVGFNGEWVETKRDLFTYAYAQEFCLEVNFAKTHLKKIANLGEGKTLHDCRAMIFGAGCSPEGYLRFIACLFAMNRWPVFWRRILRDDEAKLDSSIRIVFVGSTVKLLNDPVHYYPGFMKSCTGRGGRTGHRGSYVIPVLFPETTVLGGGSDEEYYFAFTKQ